MASGRILQVSQAALETKCKNLSYIITRVFFNVFSVLKSDINLDLIVKNENGLYVPEADVYLDPWRKVKKAFISHIHADHCRYGNLQYICPKHSLPILKKRMGPVSVQGLDYGEKIAVRGVEFSFHPAGHIPGSAQIRVASKGRVWVYSGDYKTQSDGLSHPFEPVKCDTFITECTFGLPVYRWPRQPEVYRSILEWWSENEQNGRAVVLLAYSLGKAQRLIHGLREGPGPIFCHSAVQQMNTAVRKAGFDLPKTRPLTKELGKEDLKGALIIISPTAFTGHWAKVLKTYETASASGWMLIRGAKRRRAVDRGFVVSDHADWEGLIEAVKATGAERIICTHGYQQIFSRWLSENGWRAEELTTEYGESAGD